MSILLTDEIEDRISSPSDTLLELLAERRSIKKLASGPFPVDVRERLLNAIHLTPAAYNQPPWKIILIEERRSEFWDMFELAVRSRLSGERLDRHLGRIADFRDAVAVVLVYEDVNVAEAVQSAWQISLSDAEAFVQQALGMVQLSIWLSLVGDGLATSLQHWTWLAGPEIDDFAGIRPDEFKLVSVMPVGYAVENPGEVHRVAIDKVVHGERFGGSI